MRFKILEEIGNNSLRFSPFVSARVILGRKPRFGEITLVALELSFLSPSRAP